MMIGFSTQPRLACRRSIRSRTCHAADGKWSRRKADVPNALRLYVGKTTVPLFNRCHSSCMEPSPREQLLGLFRQTLAQCLDTQDFWRGHDFRLHVGGMDITEAERAASEERIKHLENLITAMERENSET